MLKFHQVQRLVEPYLSEAGCYRHLGCARDVHYFLHPELERRDPLYRLLALHLQPEKRRMELHRGVSYFGEVGPLVVAAGFSRWQPVAGGARNYRSKKTAKTALESLLQMFAGLTTDSLALLHRELASERQVATLFGFLASHRQQLASGNRDLREELKRLATAEQFSQVLALLDLGDTVPDDEQLDLLLDRLGDVGILQDSAGFTLNRAQALTKLSDYQLSDPVSFPLFAAVGLALAGAEGIEIEIDSDETWVRFRGTHLGPHFLQEIPSFLLAPDSSPQGPSRQALGRSLLQGAGSSPMTFQLELSDTTVSLLNFPDVVDLVPWPDDLESGTFYLRRPLGWEVASRYWNSRTQPHPELSDLVSALAYLPIPWSVNGDHSSGRLTSEEGAVLVVWRDDAVPSMPVERPNLGYVVEKVSPLPGSVIFRLHPRSAPGLTGILSGLRLEMPTHRFIASSEILFWLPRLATDLSGRRLVKTQLLVELLEVLEELQRAAWGEFVKLFPTLPKSTREAWVEPLLTMIAKDQDATTGGALLDLPFLPRVGQEAISWNDWMRASRRLVTPLSRGFRYGPRDGESVVPLSETSMTLVTKLTTVEDGTRQLERMAHYYERSIAWLAQPQQALDGPESAQGLVLVWSEGASRGWMAVSDTRKPLCQVLSLSRVLPYEPWKWAPPYLAFAFNHDSLIMDVDWVKVGPESVLTSLPESLLKRLPALADLFTDAILADALRREQFCYILAFLKARGKSIGRWESLAFLPGYQDGLACLKEHPEHLTKLVQEML